MIYLSIAFFCTAGLFLCLLESRFRFWATVLVTAGGYLLALLAAFFLGGLTDSPVLAKQLPYAVGCLVFLGISLFLSPNNLLQKLFLALLCLCSYTFLDFFVPLALGVMPFTVSGAPGGILSVLFTLLFYLLLGLCLYRPFRHFSDRGISGFLLGMCMLVCFLYLLCLGKLDLLLGLETPGPRLLLAALLYLAMVFGFRCVYQAGRFRENTSLETARLHMMEMESGDFADMLTAVREVRAAQKSGEYALDTILVLTQDGLEERIPEYVRAVKKNFARNPILAKYHENPYLNAVIATKAAFAAQNGIDFSCSAAGETPFKTAELCILVNEMLTRACREAAAFPGEKKLRFSLIPGENVLRLEVLYSADPPEKEKFTLKGKSLEDVLRWLFDDEWDESQLKGLENTADIVARYSGKLTVSATPGETILQVAVRF